MDNPEKGVALRALCASLIAGACLAAVAARGASAKPEITWSVMHPVVVEPEYMERLVAKATEYGDVDSFEVCGECNQPHGGLNGLLAYEPYPKTAAAVDMAAVETYRRKLRETVAVAHRAGKPVYFWHREGFMPKTMHDDLPGLLDEDGEYDLLGRPYLDYVRWKVREAFRQVPDLDGVVLTLTEADFSVIHNSRPDRYPPAKVVETITRIFLDEHRRLGKRFIFRSFGSIKSDYESLIAGANACAGDFAFEIETKITPFDFSPFLPANPYLEKTSRCTIGAECDCLGEYLGAGYLPAVQADAIARYVGYGRAAGVDRYTIRIDRVGNSIFDSAQEANLYAYMRFIRDPGASVAQVMDEWAAKRWPKCADEMKELAWKSFELVAAAQFIDRNVCFHQNPPTPNFKFIKFSGIMGVFRDGADLHMTEPMWGMMSDRKTPGRAAIRAEKARAEKLAVEGLAKIESLKGRLDPDEYARQHRAWRIAAEAVPAMRAFWDAVAAYFDDMDAGAADGPRLSAAVKAAEATIMPRMKSTEIDLSQFSMNACRARGEDLDKVYFVTFLWLSRELLNEYSAEFAARAKLSALKDVIDFVIPGGIYDDVRVKRVMHSSYQTIESGVPVRFVGNAAFPNGTIEVEFADVPGAEVEIDADPKYAKDFSVAEKTVDGVRHVVISKKGAAYPGIRSIALVKRGRLEASSSPDEAAALRRQIRELREKFQKKNLPLGIPDEFGVFHLTPEGKQVDALEEKLKAITGSGSDPFEAGRKAGWDTKPLGPVGTLKVSKTLKNVPKLGPHPAFKPGLKIFGGGVKAQVECPPGDKGRRALAEEFAWHLGQMTGETFPVVKKAASGSPAVVFGGAETAAEFGVDEASLPMDAAVVKCKGNRLFVGGRGVGRSHALTYVLESIGCRYIWPGKLGKVIPKKSEVTLPEIDLLNVPALKVRGMRVATALEPRFCGPMEALGFDRNALAARQVETYVDRPGNRSFWLWHGVNDGKGTPGHEPGPGRYKWGHYYMDYIDRYEKSHPEWFALQPDGTRRQSERTRPCFCLSNDELVEETIRNLVADFARNPDTEALSACLPDGGHSSPCMCERCRRLDPPNAAPRSYLMFSPKRGNFQYVAMTDRVFGFLNRVADGVAARLPGKKLTAYAYSYYMDPPKKVVPSKNLVILSVAGDYVNASASKGGRDGRTSAAESIAAWSGFGNELFWRPNCLWGFNCVVPNNCARRIFNDLETFKVNGVVGTDMCCNDEQWSVKGMILYMSAKAHLNIDHLDYDTLLDDYCDAFGAAKDDVRAYFDELEKATEDAAEKRIGKFGYIDAFDVDRFAAILARAAEKAAGDALAARRVRFLSVGLEYARRVKRNKAAADSKDPRRMEYLEEYRDFMHEMYKDDDAFVACNPRRIGFYDGWLRPLIKRDGK